MEVRVSNSCVEVRNGECCVEVKDSEFCVEVRDVLGMWSGIVSFVWRSGIE